MEIFGFEIKRKSEEDKAPSFVAPINDDGAQVLEIGQGGYSIGGGYAQGTFLDMEGGVKSEQDLIISCLLYTSPSPRDPKTSRMPSSA